MRSHRFPLSRAIALAAVAVWTACSPPNSAPRAVAQDAGLAPPRFIASVDPGLAGGYGWTLTVWDSGRGLLEWRDEDRASGQVRVASEELELGAERVARIVSGKAAPIAYDYEVGEPSVDAAVRRIVVHDGDWLSCAEIGAVSLANFPAKFEDDWEWTRAVAPLELWRDLEGLFADPPSVRPTLWNPGLIRHQFDATIFELRRRKPPAQPEAELSK
ncbi:MAG: hypothetical protein JNN27_14675 [Planctomycetes bacterium]|nr:hypothetical protein [Planctomycetota bacterium]